MTEFEKLLAQKRKKFGELLEMVKYPKAGTYDLEVAEVLGVGEYLMQSEEAIIKDTQGRIWAIPEDMNFDKPGNRLASRWDVKKGMKLRVTVVREDGEKDIKEVIIVLD